jgi:hypothetical protein
MALNGRMIHLNDELERISKDRSWSNQGTISAFKFEGMRKTMKDRGKLVSRQRFEPNISDYEFRVLPLRQLLDGWSFVIGEDK